MRKKIKILWLLFLVHQTFLQRSPLPAFAEISVGSVPETLHYQGRLEDGGLPVTGTRTFLFRIYDASEGGNKLFESAPLTGNIQASLFGIDIPGLPYSILAGASPKYLEVEVGGTLLSPREKIQSAPYAILSKRVEDHSVSSATIQAGAISDAHIASGAGISASKLRLPGSGTPLSDWEKASAPGFIDAAKISGATPPGPHAATHATGGADSLADEAVSVSSLTVAHRVGIGTANPSQTLDVLGSIHLTGNLFKAGIRGITGSDIQGSSIQLTHLTHLLQNALRGGKVHLRIQNDAAAPLHKARILADFLSVDGIGLANLNVSADLTLSGAGGLDTGTEAPNTWYALYVITNESGSAVSGLLHAGTGAPALPPGFSRYRRVGWVRNDGSSNLRRFHHSGDWWFYDEPFGSLLFVNTTSPATTLTAISAAAFVPPTSTLAYLKTQMGVTHGNPGVVEIILRPNGSNLSDDDFSTISAETLESGMVPYTDFAPMPTDSSQQIQYRILVAAMSPVFYRFAIGVAGWYDPV